MYEIIYLGEVTFTKECLLWLLSIRKGEGRNKSTKDVSKKGRVGIVDEAI
jgi:hypothetical protein